MGPCHEGIIIWINVVLDIIKKINGGNIKIYICNFNNNLGIVKFTVEGFFGQRSFQKINLFIFRSLTPIFTDGKTFLFIKIRLNYIFFLQHFADMG